MSSERPVPLRPAPVLERDSGLSNDGSVRAADMARAGSIATNPFSIPRGAGAADHLNTPTIERQQQQEGDGASGDLNARCTRQRSRNQQHLPVEEPQSGRRRDTRRRSGVARLQDDQYKEQQEVERRSKQRKDIKEHIQSVCDQIEDPWLRIEEFEALRSPLLKIEHSDTRYKFCCKELIRRYTKAIEEQKTAISARKQMTVGRRGRESKRAATAEAAIAIAHRQPSVPPTVSRSGMEWPDATRFDSRPAHCAAWQDEYGFAMLVEVAIFQDLPTSLWSFRASVIRIS